MCLLLRGLDYTLSHRARAGTATRRAESILILRPSIRVAHESLNHWLGRHTEARFVAVITSDAAAHLSGMVPLHVLHTELAHGSGAVSDLLCLGWRSLRSLLNRFGTVVILCPGDDEVRTGQLVFRILGELLFSDRVVLVGPHATSEWPGGRGLIKPKRARELARLGTAIGIAVLTTGIALAAVALQETLARMRILR